MITDHAARTRAEIQRERIDETILDRYLQSPDRLDEETCRAVEQHLRKDAAARARVISFLYFYEESAAEARSVGPSC